MTSSNYKQALNQAQYELAISIQERDRLNLEIVRLQNLVRGLAISAENAEKAEQISDALNFQLSMIQAVEAIVNQSAAWLTPMQVRDALVASGYQLGHYANQMAIVHQCLIRLAADGRITAINGQYKRAEWMDAIFKLALKRR